MIIDFKKIKLKTGFVLLVLIAWIFICFAKDSAKDYENRASNSYKIAKEYYLKGDYIKSLVSYVDCITYFTLAYHIYIDKLNDKNNFFRVSEIVLNVSIESDQVNDKAFLKTNDLNKKNNILAIKSSNYLNFASTLQKMYGVDYKIATKKYEQVKNKIEIDDSILITIAKCFAKAIDIQLSIANYDKAKEYFLEFEKYYNSLDNRIKDKYAIKQILDFYRKKIGK